MSKKDKEKDTSLPQEEEAVVEVPVAEPEPEPEPEHETETETETEPETEAQPLAPPAEKKAARGIAWLALLLSLVASAGIGYLLLQDWRAQDDVDQSASSLAELRTRIASSGESLARLDRSLEELTAADVRSASDMELLQRNLDNRMQMLDSLPPRMSNLENSLAALQGVSTGARNTWLLAEAEYYMQIANAQLQLAGNPHLASLALGMADERITKLADPGLTDVRRALSNELAALEVMDKPDIEGATLTLASLALVIDSLPLRQAQQTATDDDGETDVELSGVDRAWASIKDSVSGLVRHTGPDEIATPLLTPKTEYFLRTNLSLQLQAARLALLRGEHAIFRQSLDDAAAWLDTYFENDSAQVMSAQQTITEIRGGMFAVTTPDISESLRLLRQFNSINELAQ